MNILIEGISAEEFSRKLGFGAEGLCGTLFGYKVFEVPAHGKLIDADEIIEGLEYSISEQERVRDSLVNVVDKGLMEIDILRDKRFLNYIKNRPVVIEADR